MSAALSSSSPAPRDGKRLAGFDYLRILAMVLIFSQHAMAVEGYYDYTTLWDISLGQTGVAIFCALSGYLAFREEREPPRAWLKRRLAALYPSYWLVTIAGFALTLAVGGKTLTWPLFLSQMLGTGYFTHGWELVNVVSWFISLILLCYLIATLARSLESARVPLLLAVAALCAILVANRLEVSISRHVISFCLAGLMAIQLRRGPGQPGIGVWLTGLAVLAGAAVVDTVFALPTIALALLWLGLSGSWARHPGVVKASDYSYEFFLVHGILLVGVSKLTQLALPARVSVALAASVLSAWLLRRIMTKLMDTLRPQAT